MSHLRPLHLCLWGVMYVIIYVTCYVLTNVDDCKLQCVVAAVISLLRYAPVPPSSQGTRRSPPGGGGAHTKSVSAIRSRASSSTDRTKSRSTFLLGREFVTGCGAFSDGTNIVNGSDGT
jgi:hypothetical protein